VGIAMSTPIMHPELAKYFEGGREQFYPGTLESKFARVFNKIMSMWGNPELEAYLEDLMVDKRGGRQGFPMEAMNDILLLSRLHQQVLAKKSAGGRPFSNEMAKRELQNEKIEYSPAGFFRAIEVGNERAVRLFMSSGVDATMRNGSGWTPLIASAVAGNLFAAQSLLAAGADVNDRDPQGYTPLHWAAFKGYPKVTQLLLDKGADVNIRSKLGLTPLLQAAVCGHEEVVGMLLNRGADVNAVDDEGSTALHKAAADGHLPVVKLLLAAGANREAKNARGQTPATLAKQRKNAAVVTALSE
jgi:ankyrin repeat protein